MRHVQNDMLKMQVQNAMLAQQMAEANKSKRLDKARAEASEELADLQKAEELKNKTVREVSTDKKNQKGQAQDLRPQSYKKDGTVEDGGGPSDFGEKLAKRIDIKI
jgi:predicted amino acid dehydrogenase